MRRIAILFFLIFFAVVFSSAQAPTWEAVSSQSDPYYITFVASAFEYYKSAAKAGKMVRTDAMRFTQRSPSLFQLGDAVSIAMLKNRTPEELSGAENADAYLNLVRISFSDQSKILEKSDQSPRVTLLVLEYLQQKEYAQPALEKRIKYLKSCVQNLPCSTHGEVEFINTH